jgi:putative endonuclease
MNYYVYIAYSETLDNYCVGYTDDLKERLKQHNKSVRGCSSAASDWMIVYQEKCTSRQDAHKRELEIKWKRSRTYLVWLISFDTFEYP